MQLAGRPRLPAAAAVPPALRAAAEALGQRPAVTVLRAGGRRDEQGFASLLQWTAKGAHLLELDLAVGPGDRVAVVGPGGWLPLAVCLACWWVGAEVVAGSSQAPAEDADGVRLAVVHESAGPPQGVDVLWWGDAVDGSPVGPVGEPWSVAVQSMPDQPPPPRGAADLPATVLDGHRWTQAELLAAVPAPEVDGAVGCTVDAGPRRWLPALVRPLVTGRPTVLLDGAEPPAAAGDRVERWLD